eukprot:5942432-Amphidinium_carterae.1
MPLLRTECNKHAVAIYPLVLQLCMLLEKAGCGWCFVEPLAHSIECFLHPGNPTERSMYSHEITSVATDVIKEEMQKKGFMGVILKHFAQAAAALE